MGHGGEAEGHSQPQSHGPVHHHSFQNAFSPSPSAIVEKLVRLKNSDPELFTQAWNRLPGTVRENILSYLKLYPKLLEGEYPLLLLHRAGDLSKDEVEDFDNRASSTVQPRRTTPLEPVAEAMQWARAPPRKKEASRSQRPKIGQGRSLGRISVEEIDEDRQARAPPTLEKEDTRSPRNADADSLLLAELRKISRQNKTQIGLMRRLVESSKGKSRASFSFSKDH